MQMCTFDTHVFKRAQTLRQQALLHPGASVVRMCSTGWRPCVSQGLTSFLAGRQGHVCPGISVGVAAGFSGVGVSVLATGHEHRQALGGLPTSDQGPDGNDDDPDDVEQPVSQDECN